MSQANDVSVIIPTRAVPGRRPLLLRALHSVLEQQGVRVFPIVVINGPDRDPELVDELSANPRLRIATLEGADLPRAIHHGATMVDTRWFTELDDDDLLLPGALATRVQAFQAKPDLDAVVTNGFWRDTAGDRLYIQNMAAVEHDPVRALLRKNWLLAGAWLCRTETVPATLFEGIPRFRECTYIALRLSTACRVEFLDCPTVVHCDTPRSESKTREYTIGKAGAVRRFLELDLPPDVRADYRVLLTKCRHANARLCLKEGDWKHAWGWHLQSLFGAGGWRHFPYTRRLVYALLKA